jgi:hypothetical protein
MSRAKDGVYYCDLDGLSKKQSVHLVELIKNPNMCAFMNEPHPLAINQNTVIWGITTLPKKAAWRSSYHVSLLFTYYLGIAWTI